MGVAGCRRPNVGVAGGLGRPVMGAVSVAVGAVAVAVDDMVVVAKRGASPLTMSPFHRRRTSHRPYSLLDPLVRVPCSRDRLSEQVLDLDVVPSPCARDTPGDVVQGHLDPTQDHGRVVLLLQPRPCHGRQRLRELAYDQALCQQPQVLPPGQVVGQSGNH
jgi:hypothetical protein